MENVESLDFLLGTLGLAAVPLFLAAYGGHLAAQALSDHKQRRRAKAIFWGLCLFGILIAGVYEYRAERNEQQRELRAAKADAERQRKIDEAQRTALQAQADLKAIERSNGNQIGALQKRLDMALASTKSPNQTDSVRELKEELAVMDELLRRQNTSDRPNAPAGLTDAPAKNEQASAKPCRSDALNECDNQKLLEWALPFVARVEAIEDAHMADLKALDDIKGNWIGFLVGKDKDSKWLKAYARAQEKAADDFRDCCAENVLKYHKELVQRLGGGLGNRDVDDWIEKLTKPVQSKEWKVARSEGGSKIVDLVGILHSLQYNLRQTTSAPGVAQLHR